MKKILFTLLWVKLSIFLIIIFAYNLLPFAGLNHFANFTYPAHEKISLKTAFKTWDAQHYLFLSEKGYKPNIDSDRFFPLLPILINLLTFITRNSVFSGLLLSNVASFIGFYFFYRFVEILTQSEKIAFLSSILLLAFPTSFYFSLIYSESILFLLTTGFFYFLIKNQLGKASLFSFFIPLARPTGLFIILPFFSYLLLKTIGKSENKKTNKSWWKVKIDKSIILLFMPIAGFISYLLFMQLSTGNAFTGIAMQNVVVGKWSVTNLFHPEIFIKNFIFTPLSIHGFTDSLIDRIFFIISILSLPIIYKKTGFVLFVYCLPIFAVPLLGSFMAYTRYMLMGFPIFIAAGIVISNKKYEPLLYPILAFSISLQCLFLIMHSLNYWVS